jgi:NADH-quinone oxidoreductase subunit G
LATDEATGTLVSSEGRAQRSFQVFTPEDDIRASWRWLGELAAAAGHTVANPWWNLDTILAAMAEALPVFKDVPGIAPPAGFREIGQRIPRETPRASGRTVMHAHIDVHEPTPPDDPDAPLAFSMEGFPGRPPAPLIPRYWAPGWNSVQAINKFQIEVGGPLHGGDPGRRLIEPAAAVPYFRAAQDASAAARPTAPREGELLIVPAWHIFGSEELSVLSPGIASLVPQPYVAIGTADAARLRLTDGMHVLLRIAALPGATVRTPGATGGLSASVSGHAHKLVLRIHAAIPAGVATVGVGLPCAAAMDLPACGTISPAASAGIAATGSTGGDA